METIKAKAARKAPILNGWMSEASAFKAEIMAGFGFDAITVDMQHGLQDYAGLCQAFYGLKGSEATPMARVAWNHPDQVMKALDAGAMGVICPMINSREEAEKFAEALFYPPKGERSFGPIRSAVVHDNYYSRANDDIVGFAMIETETAVKNIDDILSVKAIDGVYVGPSDLSVSHGLKPGLDREEADIMSIIRTILDKARNHGVIAAIHTDSSDYAIKMIDMGFDMVTLSSDIRSMVKGLQEIITPFTQHFSGR